MTGIKCVVFVVVLTFLLSLARGDTSDIEKSCVFMESCILPCSFRAGDGVVIHWIQVTGNTPVHSYYHNQDQLARQDQRFKDRTSLFKDQISRGNASLQLTGVEVQDQGKYQCFTSTISVFEAFITINVYAPVRKVDIQQVENRITCSSEGIYPEPELTWSTSPPSTLTLQSKPTVQQTEQQLYNINSSLILSDSVTDLVYSCTVSTRRNRKTATLFKPKREAGNDQQGQTDEVEKERQPEKDHSANEGTQTNAAIAGWVFGAISVAAIVGLAAFCIYKKVRQEQETHSGQPPNAENSEPPESIPLEDRTENGGGQRELEPNEETNLSTGD